ncbi:MAG: tyrosine-protein phosphatase [Sphingobacteriales bacterium]
MFNWFKKSEVKNRITFDYSSIIVDMHSHVLPGIDDGAQTPADSIVLIRKMMELGIKKIIATPHIMADCYKNTAGTINASLDILKAELEKEKIDIEVEAAAEHYFDETFEGRVNDHKLMTMGDNYVLFEFSFISKPPNVIPVVQRLKALGYKPILAHPERYPYMDMEQFRNLREWGVLLQLNTISLTGYFGKDAKKLAESLIDEQLVDFISSDMHHLRHAEAFKDALKTPYLEKLMFDYPLKNIMLK